MKSTAQMLAQLEGLIDTKDVTKWQSQFIADVVAQHKAGRPLTDRQLEVVAEIYGRHFA